MLTNKVNTVPTEALITLPSKTHESTSQEKETPIPPTQTSSVTSNFRFVNVPGSVFVGSYFSGDYIQIDFAHQTILNHDFASKCRILESGLAALCSQEHGLSMYDVITGVTSSLVQGASIRSKGLTESGKSLYYSSGDEGGMVFSLYVYDFQTSEIRSLGEFDLNEWLVTPSISNDGNYLIGARYENGAKAQWYIVDTTTNSIDPLGTSDNFWATYNVSWSPIDDNVLLGETNVNVEIGSCPNRIINYDVSTNLARVVVDAPYGSCYDEFGLHGGDIWSPDGSMIALMIQQGTLCVIFTFDNTQKCVPLPGSTIKPIRNLTWSPDSRYLIYLTQDYKLQMYSIADESIVSIGDIPDSLNASILVWATNN
jgi:hypothetical protein